MINNDWEPSEANSAHSGPFRVDARVQPDRTELLTDSVRAVAARRLLQITRTLGVSATFFDEHFAASAETADDGSTAVQAAPFE